jgi:UDP-galactopyranose mutase
MNFPGFEFRHIRMTEFKHMTFQKNPKTTLCREYPEAYNSKLNLPYYPIPTKENKKLLQQYRNDAEKIKPGGFRWEAGRLPISKHGPGGCPGPAIFPKRNFIKAL